MRHLSDENQFDLHENEPVNETRSYEWFHTKTRFDNKAKDNSEMAMSH